MNKNFLYVVFFTILGLTNCPILFDPCLCLGVIQDDNHLDSIHKRMRIDNLNQIASTIGDSSLDLSYKFLMEAMSLSEKLKYPKGVANAYTNLGNWNIMNRNYLEAYKNYYTSLNILQKNNLTIDQSFVYGKLGSLATKLKRFEQANDFLQKAIVIAESVRDTFNICNTYIALGQNANECGNTKEALFYFNKSQLILKKFQEPNLISNVYRDIGDLFLFIKNYDSASYYYKKVILTDLQSKSRARYNTGSAYSLLAYIEQIKGDYKKSLHYNFLALSIRKNYHQGNQMISSLINVGNSYLNLQRYDSAIYYLTTGLNLSIKNNLLSVEENAYDNLFHYYIEKRDWKSALSYYKLYTDTKEQLLIENNKSNITLFETNKILSETEKRNEILRNENDIQRLNIRIKTIQIIVLLVFIILAFFIISLIYWLYIKNKRSKLALKAINLQLDQEIEDRKKIEQQLRESESLHRFLTEHSMDVICRTGKDLKLSYISPSCMNIYGFNPSEMLAMKSHADIIHPEFHKQLKAEFDEMIQFREPTKFTFRTLSADGTYFWAESHVNPIFDDSTGELKELISVVRDVSSRIDQEEALLENARQKELLMREIHHRAKNNFAILISLMNLQLEKTTDEELHSCLHDLQFRVRTMALVHDQLYRSKNIITLSFREYMINLANVVSKAFQKDGIVLHTEIDECYFTIDTALPLGLIVNELLTNAYKYAFQNRSGGNIWVEFRPVLEGETDPEFEDIYWILTVRDDGIGLPASFDLDNASTLGMQIITVLTEQLQARLKIDRAEGTGFIILLPEQEEN
jgi:PAS domain S-box-containing protein